MSVASSAPPPHRLFNAGITAQAIAPGEPVLLVYPPGLELIAAFIACVKVGAIPVPVPPPATSGFAAASQRLTLIAKNSGAKVALTDHSVVSAISSQHGATN